MNEEKKDNSNRYISPIHIYQSVAEKEGNDEPNQDLTKPNQDSNKDSHAEYWDNIGRAEKEEEE